MLARAMISTRIFRSRWAALLWAGGIVWTAVDVANSTPAKHADTPAPASADAVGDNYTDADLAVIANAMR